MAVNVNLGAVSGNYAKLIWRWWCWVMTIRPFCRLGYKPTGFAGDGFSLQTFKVSTTIATDSHSFQ
jgi:hypothetical protein